MEGGWGLLRGRGVVMLNTKVTEGRLGAVGGKVGRGVMLNTKVTEGREAEGVGGGGGGNAEQNNDAMAEWRKWNSNGDRRL